MNGWLRYIERYRLQVLNSKYKGPPSKNLEKNNGYDNNGQSEKREIRPKMKM